MYVIYKACIIYSVGDGRRLQGKKAIYCIVEADTSSFTAEFYNIKVSGTVVYVGYHAYNLIIHLLSH